MFMFVINGDKDILKDNGRTLSLNDYSIILIMYILQKYARICKDRPMTLMEIVFVILLE